MRKSRKNTFLVTIRDYLVQRTGGTYLLVEAPWSTEHMLSELDNEELTKPFTMEEIELVVKEMKAKTGHGPHCKMGERQRPLDDVRNGGP